MTFENILNTVACILSLAALPFCIPKNKIREAALVFLFKLLLTAIFGVLVVQLGLLVYPIRLFPKAVNTSFAFEFVIYPAICAIFNINFPETKKILTKSLYYIYFCSGITIVEVIVEKQTQIIKYMHWTWYLTWITLFATFFISRQFYLWFFKLKNKQEN